VEYVNLGETGLKVSRICLGCMTYGVAPPGPLRPGSHPWAINEADSQPFFKQALDLGIRAGMAPDRACPAPPCRRL
jgi:aryl-alcohol dehydrogenase-like predicted oxidoreductase